MNDAVTTIVMTRNRKEQLMTTLRQLERPVIVVDNGSSDGSSQAVHERFGDIELIALAENLGAVARNLGALSASTRYIAFADDDSTWQPGTLELAAGLLDAYPEVALIQAQVLVGHERRPDPFCADLVEAPLGDGEGLSGVPILGFMACAIVVRRDAFLAAGGFDSVVHFGGEEERLALDLTEAGWTMCFVPELIAWHRPDPSRGDGAARRRLLARNRILTAVMRRPAAVALRRSARLLRERGGRRGAWGALGRLPAAIARRRVVSARVESLVQSLERE